MQSPLPISATPQSGSSPSTRPNEAARRREAMMFQEFARTGSADLRDQLVERFLPLARSLASRYGSRNEPLDDLIQVASVGLLKAVDRFDPERGRPFASFATPTILGELRRYYRDRVWTVRLPRSLSELVIDLKKAGAELTDELGRSPSHQELAEYLSISVEQVLEGEQAASERWMRSLDMPISCDSEMPPLIETVPHEDPGFERIEAQLASANAELDERERRVLQLHFIEDLTQSEIGEQLGVSQMQISRISRKALWKLLNALRGGEVAEMPVPTSSRTCAVAQMN